eukprot:26893-Pelagococcus_subviridis.AAC.10
MSIPFSLAIARTFAIAAPCPVSSPDLLAKNITRHAAGEMAAATSAAAVTTNPSTRTGTSLSLASRIAPTSAAISAPPSFASAAPAPQRALHDVNLIPHGVFVEVAPRARAAAAHVVRRRPRQRADQRGRRRRVPDADLPEAHRVGVGLREDVLNERVAADAHEPVRRLRVHRRSPREARRPADQLPARHPHDASVAREVGARDADVDDAQRHTVAPRDDARAGDALLDAFQDAPRDGSGIRGATLAALLSRRRGAVIRGEDEARDRVHLDVHRALKRREPRRPRLDSAQRADGFRERVEVGARGGGAVCVSVVTRVALALALALACSAAAASAAATPRRTGGVCSSNAANGPASDCRVASSKAPAPNDDRDGDGVADDAAGTAAATAARTVLERPRENSSLSSSDSVSAVSSSRSSSSSSSSSAASAAATALARTNTSGCPTRLHHAYVARSSATNLAIAAHRAPLSPSTNVSRRNARAVAAATLGGGFEAKRLNSRDKPFFGAAAAAAAAAARSSANDFSIPPALTIDA